MYNVYMDEAKMVNATDNWHPNWPSGKIQIRIACFYDNNKHNGYVFIKALGYDDEYMELEYDVSSIRMMNDVYNALKTTVYDKIPDKANHNWFEEHGFEPGI